MIKLLVNCLILLCLYDVLQQMGVTEESAESLADHIFEDNKQLQLKVQKNEKLIQSLQREQIEHERLFQVSSIDS